MDLARGLPSSSAAMIENDDDAADGFVALTPNGVVVTCSAERWTDITDKHPDLSGHVNGVRDLIESPIEIRMSRWASEIWLCYRRHESRWLCAVIAPQSGQIVTAYQTDAIKAGELIWKPSK
jgi:hypothetical protein